MTRTCDCRVTTILDPDEAPAHELAALYHERWEIETALDELKTHLRGVKRKMSSYPIRPATKPTPHRMDIARHIKVLK